MYAILNKNIALRSWQIVPYAYYLRNFETPKGLSKEEFETALLADAKHNIKENDVTNDLINKRIIFKCKKGELKLNAWQKHRSFNNRLMPRMNLQITGRCNFNCLHCFNCKDNKKLQSQLTYKEIVKLFDDAKKCGVHCVSLTGGEPLLHKDIKKIIKCCVDHDIYINEIATNGYFIKQDFLDYLNKLKQKPFMKISFDGVGYHDIMRGFKGAEKDVIRSIKLCVKNNFKVMAQVNVNKNNINYIAKTLNLLDEIGVDTIRLIRTTEVPRWIKNGGKCLSIKEYYDKMLEISKEYISKPRKAIVIIWQFFVIYPNSKSYNITTMSNVRDSQPICMGNRGMMAIGSNGNVYPCMQMSGALDYYNIKLGNIKVDNLHDLLQSESNYMKSICTTVKEKAKKNKICNKCKYYIYCGTGCPALSLSRNLIKNKKYSLLGIDEWKCLFFKNRYDLKIIKTLKGYKNITYIDVKDDKIKRK